MKYLYLFTLLLISSACFAQKQNVYYLKNDGLRVALKDSADFIRIVREPDSGSVLYNVLEFYPKGQKKMVGTSSEIDPIKLEGTCISYYANGKRESVDTYKKGIVVGQEFTFFPNGKLYTLKEFSLPDSTEKYQVSQPQQELVKLCNDSTGKPLVVDGNGYYIGYRNKFKNILEEGSIKQGKRTGEWKGSDEDGKINFTETYDNCKLIAGKSTDAGGTYNYRQRFILPSYKGGVEAFYRYLAANISYPEDDMRNGIQGKVLLSFIVTKAGSVTKIKILRSVSQRIDTEAIRILKQSKGWMPGVAYGRQVDASFTLPLSFRMPDN